MVLVSCLGPARSGALLLCWSSCVLCTIFFRDVNNFLVCSTPMLYKLQGHCLKLFILNVSVLSLASLMSKFKSDVEVQV